MLIGGQVFDKREAFGVGDVNGTGGILQTGGKKKKGKAAKDADVGVLGRCCVCTAPWERYIGKKKCYACGVPVLMCEQCCIKKPDKGSKQEQTTVRCPLCKAVCFPPSPQPQSKLMLHPSYFISIMPCYNVRHFGPLQGVGDWERDFDAE